MIIFELFIIVVGGFFIAYPLWKARPEPNIVKTSPNDELLSQKEATYAALRELDFDYALGNLTREDHMELEEKYKEKAVNILKQIEARKNSVASPSVESGLESQILRLRRTVTPSGPVRQELEEQVLRLRQSRETTRALPQRTCPKCNSGVPDDAKFCAHCGSALKPMACAKCSAPYKPGERFCSQCGASLTEEKGQ